MSKTVEIGPYSAYAIAVKYGYTGTEEQWVKEQEANRVASEQAAQQAEQARGGAEAAAARAESAADRAESAQQATESAKTDALTAIGTSKQDALNAVQEAQSGAVEAVSSAETAATEAVQAAQDTATGAVSDAQTAAVKAVDAKGKEALANISTGIDPTLSVSGKAADAKMTGDKIGELKEDTAALQERQNVLVGSESGNPVSCDDAFAAPLCGLTVYGKSTQNGTPAPDNPVPIVSAGDGGTIAVALSDGNGKAQSLILLTPTGLPGIPVTSGGNYTDSTGQQWVCDEVDLERGVRVKNTCIVDAADLKITGSTDLQSTKRLTFSSLPALARGSGANALCNRSVMITSFDKDTTHFYVNKSNIFLFIPISAENPVAGEYIFLYALAAPVETPLTAEELAAYKALTAYAPDTVVQASDGAGIKLDYQRDVNLVVKNLEDAIASMTTT